MFLSPLIRLCKLNMLSNGPNNAAGKRFGLLPNLIAVVERPVVLQAARRLVPLVAERTLESAPTIPAVHSTGAAH